MDSLLASYGSSSDEENEERGEKSSTDLGTDKASIHRPSLSSSMPQPQSLFSNPNPELNEPTKGSIFSALPSSKSESLANSLGFDLNPNRPSIFQTRIPPSVHTSSDSYEEIEEDVSKGSMNSSRPTPKSKKMTNLLDFDSIFDQTNNKNLERPPQGPNFSAIIAPKSKESANPLGLDLKPKKIVRFTPPINPNLHNKNYFGDEDDEEEDEEEEEEEREKKKPIIDRSSNASTDFAFTLPAPKNTLCLAPQSNSSIFSSRKSSLNTQLQDQNQTQHEIHQTYNNNNNNNNNDTNVEDNSVPVQTGYETMASYSNVESYGADEGHNWNNNESSSYDSSNNAMIHEMGRAKGKRGRNETPIEIVEVKQDELMKNRPRQDPNKLTGLAFGPSYQAAPSEKGKASKLHKRKHQIGTLFHDMKQKETELAERRSKGYLTKAETQAKYGW